MAKRITVLLVAAFLLVFFSAAISADLKKVKEMPAKLPIITGDEEFPDYVPIPYVPGMILSPGDTVGMTYYDYQTNGSSGTRVVIDAQANAHVAWMRGVTGLSPRHIYYNCLSPAGWTWPGTGTQVSPRTGAGYTTMGILPDDRAAIYYHNAAPVNFESLFVSIDDISCQGFFSHYYIPNRLTATHHYIWPYGTVSRNGDLHVVATWNSPVLGGWQDFIYTRSNDGGTTWTAIARVDTVMTISPIVTASPVSDKVAIVYNHPMDTTTQWENDVYYILSNDGLIWDFRDGKVNVTEYGQGGDSLFAYTDVDAVFDYNDNLQIVWNAQYVVGTSLYFNGQMLHYNNNLGQITQMAQFDSLWPIDACDFGNWNWSYAKMSIASNNWNYLFATYTSWDTSDCAADGYANGDIYCQWSMDGGSTWSTRVNLTDSHSPLCPAGDCESDHWSSLAEKVDSSIHLLYINDRDAGGIVQTEGSLTNNPVMYYTNSTLPPLLGVNDGDNLPRSFTLEQNYPNPFNATTNIDFELTEASRVELTVYDITGAKVATLLNGVRQAGKHQVKWDASAIASGVYYYTLRADGSEVTKKMTLLK